MKNITIAQLLAFEEGFRSEPYYCSEGYPTIGIGQKIGRKGDPLECYTFTVDMKVAEAMLESHLVGIKTYIDSKLPSPSNQADYARRVVLISMAYQLGTAGLDKFKKMWKAIEKGDWDTAAKETLDSKAARQTPSRWGRQSNVLKTGSFEGIYECL